jgi:hypothetical protein
MAIIERITVTLAVELIEGIDQFERNRSRFIAEAVEHELVRRRRRGSNARSRARIPSCRAGRDRPGGVGRKSSGWRRRARHGYGLDLQTGRCENDPRLHLRRYRVTVVGDEVWCDLL